jgi:hypothetical protein
MKPSRPRLCAQGEGLEGVTAGDHGDEASLLPTPSLPHAVEGADLAC